MSAQAKYTGAQAKGQDNGLVPSDKKRTIYF